LRVHFDASERSRGKFHLTRFSDMHSDEDAPSAILNGHPIFSPSKHSSVGQAASSKWNTELSAKTLSQFLNANDNGEGTSLSGRRQVMLLRDTDLILAAGKSIRMASLAGTKIHRSTTKSYKVRIPFVCYSRHSF
jgi:nucleoporin NUP82